MDESPTDAQVVTRVLDGDVEAFAILVRRYQQEFTAYAKYMTGNPDDASDVVQEGLVRAYERLGSCHDPSRFKGWLFQIISNEAKMHLRRQRRRKTEPMTTVSNRPTVSAHDPAADAEREELRRQVHGALQEVSVEQREALVLRYLHGLSLEEAAGVLGVSIPAVKMRLKRGRTALKTALEGVPL
jgi:RNA polymerase sigma-70 factor (ECF subfamily)